MVSEVRKKSPADKAGIEAVDVILKFNGKLLERSEDLPPLVADTIPGTKAQLEVLHNKKAKLTTVNVGEMKFAGTSILHSTLVKW